MDNFTLKSLTVEGFRGFNPPTKPMRFDRQLIFLFGNGGQGKSSTLRAIEWCLFGNTAFLDYTETGKKYKDELVNAHNPNHVAKATLVLQRGRKEYVFSREKEIESTKTNFTVKIGDEEFRGGDADDKRDRLLGLTFTDFYRCIYLHQESIRGLVTNDLDDRDEAMDRFLGLECLRDVVGSIPLKHVKGERDELIGEKEKADERVRGRTEEKMYDQKKLKKEAKKMGIKKIKIETARKIMRPLVRMPQRIGVKIKPLKIGPTTSIRDLNKNYNKVKKFVRESRRALLKIYGLDRLTKEIIDLQTLNQGFSSNSSEINSILVEIKKIEKKYGPKTKILLSIKTLERERRRLTGEREQVDIKSRLVQDAIKHLEEIEEEICPVCRTEIDRKKVLRDLRLRVSEYGRKKIIKIDGQIDNLKKRKDGLADKVREIEGLEGRKLDLERDRKQLVKETSKIAKKKLGKRDALIFLRGKIKKLKGHREKVQGAYKTNQEILEKIDQENNKVKIICDYLAKEEELDQLARIRERETRVLRRKIKNLDYLTNQLTKITETITTVQINQASRIVANISPKINHFYRALGVHPYYKRIKIIVELGKRGKHKNAYQIEAFKPKGAKTHVCTRFSASQMNCAALGIFLAMSRRLSDRLGFLILDDPSQNLDLIQKKALAKTLKGVIHRNQIIVSTQDAEFQKFLLQQIPKRGTIIHNFVGWNEVDGPKIKTSVN